MARQHEPQDEMQQTQKYLMLLIFVIVLLIVGAIIWALSAAGLVKGPWSGLFGPVFTAIGAIATVVGVVTALFQRNHPSSTEAPSHTPPPPLLRSHVWSVRTGNETILGKHRCRGALIVIGNKKLSGSTVHLYHGFDRNSSRADVASNIVWCRVDGSPAYAAIFPDLKPGRYSVSIHPIGPRTNVTIKARRIAEIDWRLYTNGKSKSLVKELGDVN